MNNILSKLSSVFGREDFFATRYLCDSSIASNRFRTALQIARDYYGKNRHLKISPELIHESWQQNIAALEAYFADQMNENFTSNEVINGTMVFTNRKAHKLEIRNIENAFARKRAAEFVSTGLNTAFLSGKSRRAALINSIHHLHHLMRFEQVTGRKIGNFRNVVEFGGGYGNMARVVHNIGGCKTYSIIDLMLFSCIQSVFLSTVAGCEHVAFDDGGKNESVTFLLHPLFSAREPATLNGELFISTWALSESTSAAYEWVVAHDWFGASNLLLAYNEHWKPWPENELETSLSAQGWHVAREAIPFLPGSFYLFATR